MINQKIKLIRPGVFLSSFSCEESLEDKILVRPTVLSICAADQRYFCGNRPKEVLAAKLPMCLIHEAIGEVLYDPFGCYATGQNVILLPNAGNNEKSRNYATDSFFRSSSVDGFTQEFVGLRKNEVIPFFSHHPKYYVFSELISVCYQAISQVPSEKWKNSESVGVWGDGVVGYLLSFCIKDQYPTLEVKVFGRHEEKLALFSHADVTEIFQKDRRISPSLDIAFEAVGGIKAGDAINEILSSVRSQAFICLTGVSESRVPINTRYILEKGLTLVGTSRSLSRDFKQAKSLLDKLEEYSPLDKVISNELVITSCDDLKEAFYKDQKVPFKTLLKWEI